jgi:hypothetical protein
MKLLMMGKNRLLDSSIFFYRIILETDSSLIAQRVAKANSDPSSIPIADQTLSQVWRQAQEQVARGWFGK